MKTEYKKVSDLLALNDKEVLQEFEMVELKGGAGPLKPTGSGCGGAGGRCRRVGNDCADAGKRCPKVGSGCAGAGDHCLISPIDPPIYKPIIG